MLKPYAITVYYIFTVCIEPEGKETNELMAKGWAVTLFDRLRIQLGSQTIYRSWFENPESALHQLRRMYRTVTEKITEEQFYKRIPMQETSIAPLLAYSRISGTDVLDRLFERTTHPPRYKFFKSGKEVVRVIFTVDPEIYRPLTGIAAEAPEKEPAQQLLRFGLPIRPAFFLGRATLLRDLHSLLTDTEGRHPLVLLHGVGGMGKSTIIQEYLRSDLCQHHFERILCFTVNGDLKQAYITGVSQALGLTEKTDALAYDPAEQLRFLTGELSRYTGRNLIVVDNINEPEFEEFRRLAPLFEASGWRILVTTRTAPDGFIRLDVGELEPEDAATLFAYHYLSANQQLLHTKVIATELRTYTADKEVGPQLDALLRHIVRHTLLTELLAKHARKNGLSLGDILKRLQEEDSQHPEIERLAYTGEYQHLNTGTLYVYILGLFDTDHLVTPTGNPVTDAEHAKKVAMLRFFSVLPVGDIPLNHLKMLWCVGDTDAVEFTDRLDEMRQGGWMQGKVELSLREVRQIAYRMHPLVQDAVHHKLKPDIHNCRPLIVSLTNLFDPAMPNPEAYQHYSNTILRKLKGLAEKLRGINHTGNGN